MRVKISTNPPLPPVRAWFPLTQPSTHGQTISTFKSVLCASLLALDGISPSSLHLSIDGFELLDNTELTVVRDGDLISVDARDAPPTDVDFGQAVDGGVSHATRPRVQAKQPPPSRKRKRTPSTVSSESESDIECSTSSSSSSETSSTSGSESESDVSSAQKAKAPAKERTRVSPIRPKSQPSASVPPGYGKPQTRARNLRRRLKRTHEHEATNASGGGPVSGANAVVREDDVQDVPALMSLSLRNKNKAKNFKSLMNRPLPPKIVFGDEDVSTDVMPAKAQTPRLVPPSLRSSLPPNLFVTSVDVEADLNGEDDGFECRDDTEQEVDVGKVEAMANERWTMLKKPTREKAIAPGTLIGYKALGIDAVTFTPGQVLTVVRVESCDFAGLVVRPLRAVSFSWDGNAEKEEHPWEEILGGDWRVLQ